MIWESRYWKSDLQKDAEILRRWSTKKHSSRRDVLFEKKIFISAFIIRKLTDAKKINVDFPKGNIPIQKFLRINREKPITLLNWHKIDSFYDLKTPISGSINIEDLSDLIIHSFIYCLVFAAKDHVDSFYITSDKKKDDFLWSINLKKFTELLNNIGHTELVEFTMEKKKKERCGYKISKRKYSQ